MRGEGRSCLWSPWYATKKTVYSRRHHTALSQVASLIDLTQKEAQTNKKSGLSNKPVPYLYILVLHILY